MTDLKSLFERANRIHHNARTLPGCPSIANRKIISGLLSSAERQGCLTREELAQQGVDYVLRENEILNAGASFTRAAAIDVTCRLKNAVRQSYFKEIGPLARFVIRLSLI